MDAPKKSQKKKASEKIKILFVCTGNTCRSPMAEYLMKDYLKKKGVLSDFTVSGAGISAETGAPMSENALKTLNALHINGGKHKAKQLTLRMAQNADIIVCMTQTHKRAIGVSDKLTTVSEITGAGEVADPYGLDEKAYEKTAGYLLYACPDIEETAIKFHQRRKAGSKKIPPT